MHFRAVRPINIKKIVRLEVSDVEQIMGLVQAENIQVHAEAYDVALDMSFPKGENNHENNNSSIHLIEIPFSHLFTIDILFQASIRPLL